MSRISHHASWRAGTWLLCAYVMAAAVPAYAAATLRAVRHITTPGSTRVIIEFSEPVHYRLQRVAGRPQLGVPPRVYVDVPGAALGEAARAPVELREGPALRLRATEPDAMTVRLILDVPGLTDLGAFPMLDPFRLVVDVRGTPRAQPLAAAPPQAKVAPTPPAAERRRLKVVLDPGHGGKDPGALGTGGIAEKDIALAIAQRLRTHLGRARDVDVVLTRETDVFLALEERTARANAERADLFVSIHTNASDNHSLAGVETYYLNNTNDRATIRLAEMENGLRGVTHGGRGDRDVKLILSDLIQSYKIQESVALADDIQQGVVNTLDSRGTPVNNLGVKRGPFYVLVGAGMPCVLVEVSFVTNQKEGARLAQPAYQEGIAEGLSLGVQRFVDKLRGAENL